MKSHPLTSLYPAGRNDPGQRADIDLHYAARKPGWERTEGLALDLGASALLIARRRSGDRQRTSPAAVLRSHPNLGWCRRRGAQTLALNC